MSKNLFQQAILVKIFVQKQKKKKKARQIGQDQKYFLSSFA